MKYVSIDTLIGTRVVPPLTLYIACLYMLTPS